MTTRTGCWPSRRGPIAAIVPRPSPGGLAHFLSSAPAGLVLVAGWVGLLGLSPAPAAAHSLTITQVQVSFDEPGKVAVRIDIDLTGAIGSAEGYNRLASAEADLQRGAVDGLFPAC